MGTGTGAGLSLKGSLWDPASSFSPTLVWSGRLLSAVPEQSCQPEVLLGTS